MKKFLKKIPTNILIIVLAILLLFVGYLYKIFYDENVDFLAYTGAIIGVLFTVVGVTMTINYEKVTREKEQIKHDQERKEELSAEYKPIIVFSPSKKAFECTSKSEKDYIFPFFDNLQISCSKSINFDNGNIPKYDSILTFILLCNIGRAECYNIYIEINFSYKDVIFLSNKKPFYIAECLYKDNAIELYHAQRAVIDLNDIITYENPLFIK